MNIPILQLGKTDRALKKDEIIYAFFSRASEHYIEMRVTNRYMPILSNGPLYHAAACLEKTMKLYLITLEYKSVEECKKFSHDIKKLREECAKHNSLFQAADIEKFCNEYGGVWHLAVWYGSDGTWFSTSPSQIVSLLDRIFIRTLVLLKEAHEIFIVQGSTISMLLNPNDFWRKTISNSNPIEPLMSELTPFIFNRNDYINEFVKISDEFWKDRNNSNTQ